MPCDLLTVSAHACISGSWMRHSLTALFCPTQNTNRARASVCRVEALFAPSRRTTTLWRRSSTTVTIRFFASPARRSGLDARMCRSPTCSVSGVSGTEWSTLRIMPMSSRSAASASVCAPESSPGCAGPWLATYLRGRRPPRRRRSSSRISLTSAFQRCLIVLSVHRMPRSPVACKRPASSRPYNHSIAARRAPSSSAWKKLVTRGIATAFWCRASLVNACPCSAGAVPSPSCKRKAAHAGSWRCRHDRVRWNVRSWARTVR
mmetsp:Transcript_29692/g.72930  ORF Transcript_29692/g.72930 Transcript_29692/m.72930 type:complete len:262 (+) Transcript_29692:534-1319(+)